jgi:hypothetical protein
MPIDYKKYPSDWQQTRNRILERAKNTCECCSLEKHSTVWSFRNLEKVTVWSKDLPYIRSFSIDPKEVKVVLTIAHLDHDETNHQVTDERLKAMCQLCHLRYDAKEKVIRRQNRSNVL